MNDAIIVLGGYGNFGARIAAALAADRRWRVIVAGRDPRKAQTLAPAGTEPMALDAAAPDFATRLARLGAGVLIHTAGPFQGQDYTVASACIDAGCHYVDIADGRAYVGGIDALDARARSAGVLVASGASSLPALSSAAVDRLLPRFERIESIRLGITSSSRPPGIATMRGVLGYVGRPIRRLESGRIRTVHGWQDLHLRRYPAPLGRRLLGACDVPDLELFPRRYPGLHTVTFHAGLGMAATTLATWGFSWLVRAGAIADLADHAGPLRRLAGMMEPLGSAYSAMHVEAGGRGRDGAPLHRVWHVIAGRHHGPQIPCLPAIALARRLLRGQSVERGAMACMGLLGVEEILGAVPGLDLRVSEA
ncbi:MAG: saccharopine dehydrogenase family protein [Gammaproteobacteria bacterium]